MKRALFVILFGLAAPMSHALDQASPCTTVEACIALIPEKDVPSYSNGEADEAVKAQLRAFGRDALEPLAKLSAHPNSNKRQLADTLIADIKDIRQSDFELVRQVIQNNVKLDGSGGWAYRLLGRMGGDQAVEFLVSELVREGKGGNQIVFALAKIGAPAIPHLLNAMACKNNCTPESYAGFQEVFDELHQLEISDQPSALALLALAKNNDIHPDMRKLALEWVGYITAESAPVEAELIRMVKANPELSEHVLTSLKVLKSPYAADLLVAKLAQGEGLHREWILRDIGHLGHTAKHVGAEVEHYLNAEDWNTRAAVARTLGFIGYEKAAPRLQTMLLNEQDWLQVHAALQALHWLQHRPALDDIEYVATSHWYALVRDFAAVTAQRLRADQPPLEKDAQHYYSHRARNCSADQFAIMAEPEQIKIYDREFNGLNQFSYKHPWCADKEAAEADEYLTEFCASLESMVQPNVAAKVGDSWLTGTNNGEWGGEMMAFYKDGSHEQVLWTNIEDIYSYGSTAYATTGLAHLGMNNGMLYRATEIAKGFAVEPIYRLPGAPMTSWKINPQEILINTYSGPVIFNPATGLRTPDGCEVRTNVES
ncbi:HEAT repeat domain-containing protein [Pseudidiomarina sp. GXY010]|uniref:HEAT repeat domain-containing protein n=1 Tax=Pseudidiomarina fusca TaxID=2965078 RepID=A0ABU3KYZ1_9GAMM|nr:HEAT repeat domain-containing protein [Pseudidiomarina sp. GXY010]MDT7526718.1 HEAT repeat domain-containing protein [Pseudidiomarina sp. GXY010]